ncbi:hypothetical protein B0H10DRAFT_2314486 [Mycena sp. CBHHK59/15]|nr:hypothetical protein B0H10DRAFT_2314486 [Mycena sp. CBHHK59/15]
MRHSTSQSDLSYSCISSAGYSSTSAHPHSKSTSISRNASYHNTSAGGMSNAGVGVHAGECVGAVWGKTRAPSATPLALISGLVWRFGLELGWVGAITALADASHIPDRQVPRLNQKAAHQRKYSRLLTCRFSLVTDSGCPNVSRSFVPPKMFPTYLRPTNVAGCGFSDPLEILLGFPINLDPIRDHHDDLRETLLSLRPRGTPTGTPEPGVAPATRRVARRDVQRDGNLAIRVSSPPR